MQTAAVKLRRFRKRLKKSGDVELRAGVVKVCVGRGDASEKWSERYYTDTEIDVAFARGDRSFDDVSR